MLIPGACNTNNTALTVFLKATQEYGIPRRVRSDKGGEVCYFMVAHHGPSRIFNTQLNVFGGMYSAAGCPVSELDLFVLYLPRIRKSLSEA